MAVLPAQRQGGGCEPHAVWSWSALEVTGGEPRRRLIKKVNWAWCAPRQRCAGPTVCWAHSTRSPGCRMTAGIKFRGIGLGSESGLHAGRELTVGAGRCLVSGTSRTGGLRGCFGDTVRGVSRGRRECPGCCRPQRASLPGERRDGGQAGRRQGGAQSGGQRRKGDDGAGRVGRSEAGILGCGKPGSGGDAAIG